MSFDPVSIVVLAAYASLALELTVLAVPSEASTRQLVAGDAPRDPGDALASARERSSAAKLFRFGVPTALGVVLFLIPLGLVFRPDAIDYLGRVTALETAWLPWLGVGLIATGRAVTLRGAVRLRRGAAPAFDDVFGFTRNPILVGMHLFYLGNCCIFPCVVLMVGFVPYALYMHARVRMEEGYLARKLGEPYESYLRRVPRYLLF